MGRGRNMQQNIQIQNKLNLKSKIFSLYLVIFKMDVYKKHTGGYMTKDSRKNVA